MKSKIDSITFSFFGVRGKADGRFAIVALVVLVFAAFLVISVQPKNGSCGFGILRCFALWLHQLGARRGGARRRRPLSKAWKARDRIDRHVCKRVNCSAFLAKPRRNVATAASAFAAGSALACELVTRIVV